MTPTTEQLRAKWRIISKIEEQRETWLAHTADTDPVKAFEDFERRTNKQPEKQYVDNGLLLSGPVEEE